MTLERECSRRQETKVERILIIEDNRDAADTLRDFLALLGFEVKVAYSGLEGIRLATEWRPTVVLSDIGLPGMDGFEVARTIRTRLPSSTIKLIALTAYSTDEDRRLALQAGFNHYLIKPADLDVLQELLETLGAGPADFNAFPDSSHIED